VVVRCEGFFRGRDVTDRERNLGVEGCVLAVLLLGLVAVEFVGAQPHTGGHGGRLFGLHGPGRQFGDDRHGLIARTKLAGRRAAELEAVIVLEIGRFAGSDHNQPAGFDAVGRQKIERGAVLALELVGRGSALDHAGRRSQRLGGDRTELQRIVAEYDQNTARRAGKRDEADLNGVGHRVILQNQGCLRVGNTIHEWGVLCVLPVPGDGSVRVRLELGSHYDLSTAALPSADVAGGPHLTNY
jgi:hypothetical protein